MSNDRRKPRAVIFSLLLGLLLGQALGVRADEPAAREDYEALVSKGLALTSAGRWAEAYALFQRAHEVKPGPRPLRGMAIVLFELRRYVEAVDCAARALTAPDEGRPLTGAMRAELRSLRDQALRFVVRPRIEVQPEDAVVSIDGRPITQDEVLLDEGAYTVDIRREGYAPRTFTIRARIGQTPEIVVTLDPLRTAPSAGDTGAAAPAAAPVREAPIEEPSHLASWTLLGVGGAALLAGTITGVMAHSTFSDLDDRCPGVLCTAELRDDVDRGRTLETLTSTLLAAGGITVVAGLVVRFVVERPAPRETPSLSLSPACSASGCGVSIAGRL